jgi:hypothetical protein
MKELPMSLSEEYVAKYKELCKKHYGLELSREEALDQATKLLSFFRWLYRPMPESEFKAIMELHRKEQETKANPQNP